MKKNDEKILKYISDSMNETERTSFESELEHSEDLRTDLDEVRAKLGEIIIPRDIEADERYFANILPRVMERLEEKKNFFSWKIAYYLTPTAAAVVVLSLFLFNSKTEFDLQYKELANAVVNNFSDQEVSDNYFAGLESNPADLIFTALQEDLNIQLPSELEINSDSYGRLIDNPVSEDYRTFRGLSDNELEIIYNELNASTSEVKK